MGCQDPGRSSFQLSIHLPEPAPVWLWDGVSELTLECLYLIFNILKLLLRGGPKDPGETLGLLPYLSLPFSERH